MLNRRRLVADILAERGETLLVSGLGAPSYDAAAAGDHPLNFYLWGAMGSAAMIGLGLALARPERRVLVITGDGELLMGLGALATIAAERPRNLAILVLDNEAFGETGRQAGLTGRGVALSGIAAAAGFTGTLEIAGANDTSALVELLYRTPGPVLAVAKISLEPEPQVLPERDGRYPTQRFRAALLGPERARLGEDEGILGALSSKLLDARPSVRPLCFPRWSPFVGDKRERGAAEGSSPKANAAAAPATVGGEPAPRAPLGNREGGCVTALSREPGDLPSRGVGKRSGRGAPVSGSICLLGLTPRTPARRELCDELWRPGEGKHALRRSVDRSRAMSKVPALPPVTLVLGGAASGKSRYAGFSRRAGRLGARLSGDRRSA